ncbi:MAG: UDP-glucose 4-epimerase [Thermoprotei archaeon]|nr:MAG: UDP-glucose 4-epimerase [Thermoprotei archaeon]
MSKILVTGGAGFIGSHLVDRLVNEGYEVVVIDNLSSGRIENIREHIKRGKIEFIRGDLKNIEDCKKCIKDVDVIFHLAANPEVRLSTIKPSVHFNENIVATFNLLEAARERGGVEKIIFASSSTVYGDARKIPTPEDHELMPISIYGASKAACESLICAYAHLYGFKAVSLRLANIIGPRSEHGVIYDFILKLLRNPNVLEVLGDGTQRKSYLYIDDTIDAFITVMRSMTKSYDVYNVGNEDWITVNEIARIVIETMGLKDVKIVYRKGTSDGRGWPGDVKYMLLDISRIKELGWRPKYTSREAVKLTAEALVIKLKGLEK